MAGVPQSTGQFNQDFAFGIAQDSFAVGELLERHDFIEGLEQRVFDSHVLAQHQSPDALAYVDEERFPGIEFQCCGIGVAAEPAMNLLLGGIEKQENLLALVNQAVIDFADFPFAVQRHHFDQAEHDCALGIQ